MGKRLFDFDSVRTVGILYHVSDQDAEVALNEFIDFLKRKKIAYSVLGYFHGKTLPPHIMVWKDINYLTKKDSDWLSIPNSETAKNFVHKEFDMLINCSMKHFRVIDHLVAASTAACKIGPGMGRRALYDLVIDVQHNANMKFYVDNLKRYLPLLKKQCTLTEDDK